ncbi:MAG: class I SAM-dependent methyltransferase [Clostridia bacterium]|nr:class I SAM-dependent methyltransferase [Clostridia bacterium]
MKINYDFYTGKDEYCDGDIEKKILEYMDKYDEKDFEKVFENDIRWPVFYHLTPLRKNILNWYPFKENAEVLEIGAGMGAITGILCEKAGHVTSVELSKQRASAIAKRCKDKENLEIIVGNFNHIKFDKKFDYITLIGVLEYAPLYTNTDNPFNDFLTYIKSLLKDDGKLLIAIENQFGMKYFSGANEDHTAKKYDGIVGYENKNGIRTFGKEELNQILVRSGFEYTKFYYPMPDYKLPQKIFSDEYQPIEKVLDYKPYTSCNESVNFDEKEAYKDIIKNNMFGFFANSFFVECSSSRIDTYISFDNYRPIEMNEKSDKFFKENYLRENNENQLNMENIELKKENEKLKKDLYNIINSKSWRITKFLRREKK